nr:immunoglobulin light chain junction region [Macaca mulatta]MOY01805.1 immunoglobulin light chain junction region [Macaca mulatta]
CLQDYRAPFTF